MSEYVRVLHAHSGKYHINYMIPHARENIHHIKICIARDCKYVFQHINDINPRKEPFTGTYHTRSVRWLKPSITDASTTYGFMQYTEFIVTKYSLDNRPMNIMPDDMIIRALSGGMSSDMNAWVQSFKI